MIAYYMHGIKCLVAEKTDKLKSAARDRILNAGNHPVAIFNSENYWWAVFHDHDAIRQFFRDLKASHQRIVRGYADKDIWNMFDWFLNVIPTMLEQLRDERHGSPGYLGENYTNNKGILVNDTCHEEWTAILNEMIFLFREANEETCTRKNPYADDWEKAHQEFSEKYGMFGEKLLTEADKTEHGTRMYTPRDVPEYQDIMNKWLAAEKDLELYRVECKDKAFKLFAEHFFALWD